RSARRLRAPRDVNTGWNSPNMAPQAGYGPSLGSTTDKDVIKRQSEPVSMWIERLVTGHLFERRPPDDRIFGGDHSTAKMHAMNELKNMDRRLATWNHFDLSVNSLKTAKFYTAANGTRYTNAYVE